MPGRDLKPWYSIEHGLFDREICTLDNGPRSARIHFVAVVGRFPHLKKVASGSFHQFLIRTDFTKDVLSNFGVEFFVRTLGKT